MTLRELVIDYRAKHDLSQRQFANQCCVSNGYIAMLEKNMNPKTGQPIVPSIPYLTKIANGMGLTLSELFSMVEDMPVDIGAGEKEMPATSAIISEITGILSSMDEEQLAQVASYIRFIKSGG